MDILNYIIRKGNDTITNVLHETMDPFARDPFDPNFSYSEKDWVRPKRSLHPENFSGDYYPYPQMGDIKIFVACFAAYFIIRPILHYFVFKVKQQPKNIRERSKQEKKKMFNSIQIFFFFSFPFFFFASSPSYSSPLNRE